MSCTALHCAKHRINREIPKDRSESPAEVVRVIDHVNAGATGIKVKNAKPRYRRT